MSSSSFHQDTTFFNKRGFSSSNHDVEILVANLLAATRRTTEEREVTCPHNICFYYAAKHELIVVVHSILFDVDMLSHKTWPLVCLFAAAHARVAVDAFAIPLPTRTPHSILLQRRRSVSQRRISPTEDDDSGSHSDFSVSSNAGDFASSRAQRRQVLQSALLGLGGAAGLTSNGSNGQPLSANAATPTTATGLIADLPMIRVKIPNNGLGNDYIAISLCVPGQTKPVDFILDTGLTLELMSPHLRQQLGLTSQSTSLRGLAAGGASSAADLVAFRPQLCDNGSGGVALPELHASVLDFPQEHIDPQHDPIEGMLGQEFLSRFDVDLDFGAGRVRLYRPGTAPKDGLVVIPATVINETGLLGIRLTGAKGGQPILAFIDCGSTFSAVNWQGAAYLGMPPKDDSVYRQGPFILAVGIDGRPMQLPTVSSGLSFAGNAQVDAQGRLVGFEMPPSNWKPWKPIKLAVGDLPVFPQVLGDGTRPYTGPAALIGLDVLSQRRRCIIESAGDRSDKTRVRNIFVSPS